jgi:hypothetical protein
MTITPGMTTSEFKLTLVALVGDLVAKLSHQVTTPQGLYTGIASIGLYALSRGLAKWGGGTGAAKHH